VEGAVAEASVRPGEDVTVNGAGWWHHLAPDTSMDEFGNLSTKLPWTPVPIVRLVRWEQSGSWAGRVSLVDRGGDVDLDQAVRHPHSVNDGN